MTSSIKLLALDPGHTTGWALFDPINHALLDYGTFMHGGSTKVLWNFLNTLSPPIDQFVWESFHLYAHKAQSQIGNAFFTVEVIGVLRLYCELYQKPYKEQTAQVGKQIWTDYKLRRYGFYVANKHSRDAIRHGLRYMNTHRHYKESWNDA